MVLVLLGGEPLENLEQWARELFLGVPSGRGPRPAFNHVGHPYTVLHACFLPSTNPAPGPYLHVSAPLVVPEMLLPAWDLFRCCMTRVGLQTSERHS